MAHSCPLFSVRPLLLVAALALAAGAPVRGNAQTPPGTQASGAGAQPAAGGRVTLDFVNADIDAVARTMATLTGRNVVVDPRVKGTLSLTSTVPVSPAQALQLFAAQLRIQGYALVEQNGLALVLPEAEAKLQAGSVSAGVVKGGGQIQTQIFRLTHENANNLVPVLRPLISPNNTINVNPGTNALVITDYGDNLQRIARIIAALDVSHATGVEVVPLKHAVASDLAPLVARLLESGGSAPLTPTAAPGQAAAAAVPTATSGGGYATAVLPEPRSNAIILRAANPAKLALARSLIEQLDQPAPRVGDSGGSNIHVVYLKNADATKLAVTLRAALASLPGQSATGAAAAGGGGSANVQSRSASSSTMNINANTGTGTGAGLASGPSIDAAGGNQPSTGGQIQADPATNSLIISAPEPVYRELRAVIDKLDQRRAQVFVESLIAEVRADKSADFGIQWQGLFGGGNTIGILGTNYATPSAGGTGNATTNIFSLVSQFAGANSGNNYNLGNVTTPPPTGFNLGFRVGNLLALANFIQSSGAGNVLSTPTLLTLDNEEAKIIVGQNVPFVTGSYTNTGSTTNTVNPFQTYERKDVGLTLRVRPQISADGTIKMVIYQEVSDVVQGTTTLATGPTTNKRAIESSVLVNDGSVVVLGGLLEDKYYSNEDKVPGLGDIPVLGNLFKTQSRALVKTNLMVFLRPIIVRDAADSEAFSLNRYDLIRAAQGRSQPAPSSVLQINQAPVLPAVTPVQTPTPTSSSGWSRPAPPPPLIELPASGESSDPGGSLTSTRP
ncbi:type II secretion system secretin GspD [Ottowia sp.]|uniref:type II secretion system secretin GspD n=1 Tax=Ottowia sp. TaxID=1898956 RepID=UPI003942DD6A